MRKNSDGPRRGCKRASGGSRSGSKTTPPEKTKSTVGKEQFVASLMTLVGLAVDGLPKGFRSTQARRNKLLRNFAGDADRCCEQAFATTMSEDTIQFLVAFVPGFGAC